MSISSFISVVPKINTKMMDEVLGDVITNFSGTTKTSSLWICGRSSSFGFRPSLNVKAIFSDLVKKAKSGYIVITPIVFYICDSENIEEESKLGENEDRSKFLVFHHYNILLSYLKKDNTLNIERYEPSDSKNQGNLDTRLSKLLLDNIVIKAKYELIHPFGLQAVIKDKVLCGHHILYWLFFRLKYGKSATIEMLARSEHSPGTLDKFKGFCKDMTEVIQRI